MGRKPAPQPLTLSESALPASDRLPETLKIVSPDSPLNARSPASPNSTYRDADSDGLVQTLSQAGWSSQPLSQVLPQVQQTKNYQQALHVANLVQQPLDDLDSPGYARSVNTPTSSTFSYSQPQQQPQQQQRPLTSQQLQPAQQLQQRQLGHGRRHNEDKASKSNFFFHFGKSAATKASEKLASKGIASASTSAQSVVNARTESASRGYDSPSAKQTLKSTENNAQQHIVSPSITVPSLTEPSIASPNETELSSVPLGKKGKQKTFARLGRTKSSRDENENLHPLHSNTSPAILTTPDQPEAAPMRVVEQPERAHQPVGSLKTVPLLSNDQNFRDMMASSTSNHSADRAIPRDMSRHRDGQSHHRNQNHARDGHRNDRDREHSRMQSTMPRDRDNGGGYTFFNGLKNSSKSAADLISKGLFGKNTRSASTTEREPPVDDEHYVLKVINQPLVEQTRLTRISKRLEDSRDKTEFWMPAFPWRAIDYLNYKGTDVEGLYRVPGSGPQIKKWQRKFDEEYDVDLFAQDDLYDINIIGSMLKAWLRELPDELFPKEAQERIARECAGAETVPQMLVDELSNLSPFKYYLLFAITCHLSLLLAHSEKNKMDYRNLCICFQPCMKIDAFSFKFLVCDWRDCWKGCVNEPQYIDEEYRLFDTPPPWGIGSLRPKEDDQEEDHYEEEPRIEKPEEQPKPAVNLERPAPALLADSAGSTVSTASAVSAVGEDRNMSSSDSSRQWNSSRPENKTPRKKKGTAATIETGSVASNETLSTTLTVESQRVTTPPRQSGDLRPLSPIKPLSPLGF